MPHLDGGTLSGNAVNGAGGSGGAIINAGGRLTAEAVTITCLGDRAGGGIEADADSTKLSGMALRGNDTGRCPATAAVCTSPERST